MHKNNFVKPMLRNGSKDTHERPSINIKIFKNPGLSDEPNKMNVATEKEVQYSEWLNLEKEVRQGCPNFLYPFIIVVELLSFYIKEKQRYKK